MARHLRQHADRGIKLDGTRSQDMCTCCYSIGCDPMSMSLAFQRKIHGRLRQGLCPACGKPKGFCTCKSCLPGHGEGVRLIQTHDNRKLRRARADVAARERAYRLWQRNVDALADIIGDEVCGDINVALSYHRKPDMPWSAVKDAVARLGLDAETLRYAWGKEAARA